MTGDTLFGAIVDARRSRATRTLGAALALGAWSSLWVFGVAGIAAPLGAMLRSSAVGSTPVVMPVAPAAEAVSPRPIAAAPCAC